MSRDDSGAGNWDVGLSEEQRIAASHVGGHARLLAGPGTGKTRCLTRRILYLVQEVGVKPGSILALTFTRAASAELRSRVRTELGDETALPQISTLHSYALRMLLTEGAGSRLPQAIRIADDFEERWLIEEDLKGLLGLSTVRDARDLLARLSSDWERLDADAEDWQSRFPDPKFLGAWQEHREVYGYTLRAEMVYQLKTILQERGGDIAGIPEHLLVDEYQDLNSCDLAVVTYLAEAGASLYVAGDDDQSIYGFRYADPNGIRRFPQAYAGAAELSLEECRRCSAPILNLALFVARQDVRRIEKDLKHVPGNENGDVRVCSFPDQYAEAHYIANRCRSLISEQSIPEEGILILLRSDRNRAFSTPIREALTDLGLAASTWSNPFEPLDRKVGGGRSLLALLRLAMDRSDSLAWRTVLQFGENGVGDATVQRIYEFARARGIRYTEAIRLISEQPTLVQRGAIVAQVVVDVEGVLDAISDRPDEEYLRIVESLAKRVIPDDGTREEVMALLEAVASQVDAASLADLMRGLSASLGAEEQGVEKGRINIMSMHQAKGLTADAVFVVAAEDEYIPGRAEGTAVEDERRLLYVSLTRAKQALYITHCDRRLNAQAHTGRAPGIARRSLTRFLSGGPVASERC